MPCRSFKLFIYSCLIFIFDVSSVDAGLNKFTKLDQLGEWFIERKLDSSNDKVLCRASMIGNGTWFGARVRLDHNDELVLPPGLVPHKYPGEKKLDEVKYSLARCRSDLLYISNP